MLLLVSGATAFPRSTDVGHLIVPRQWNDPASLDLQPGRWAMDNGAFSGFDEGAFVRMLEAYRPVHVAQGQRGCLFVVAPDVVGDAAATRARWAFWSQLIEGLGFVPAFVAQDGLSPEQLPRCLALFIGGTTAFKEGPIAETLCGYAKARGIWIHMGRVNSKRRLRIAERFGVNSYDGTGTNIAPDINIPKMLRFENELQQQPGLGL